MASASLAEVFAKIVGEPVAADRAGLQLALEEYLTAARSQWAEFSIEDDEFTRFLAASAKGGSLPPVAHAADLFLACACARGIPSAILAFRRSYGTVIDGVLLQRNAAQHLADDARQILEQRLLIGDGPGARPKIADYRGLGPLKSWVASSAARVLSTLRRSASRKREIAEPTSDFQFGVELDPELLYLKQRYGSEVQRAIVEALDELSARDRTLLRLHLVERATIDVLGGMYAVNRATAARWLAAARRSLAESARSKLRARLQLTESQCDSLVALVDSELHVSVLRHLS